MTAFQQLIDDDLDPSRNIESHDVLRTVFLRSGEAGTLCGS